MDVLILYIDLAFWRIPQLFASSITSHYSESIYPPSFFSSASRYLSFYLSLPNANCVIPGSGLCDIPTVPVFARGVTVLTARRTLAGLLGFKQRLRTRHPTGPFTSVVTRWTLAAIDASLDRIQPHVHGLTRSFTPAVVSRLPFPSLKVYAYILDGSRGECVAQAAHVRRLLSRTSSEQPPNEVVERWKSSGKGRL